jgi:pimeloyl-ACP methyl ester carboxylesterase
MPPLATRGIPSGSVAGTHGVVACEPRALLPDHLPTVDAPVRRSDRRDTWYAMSIRGDGRELHPRDMVDWTEALGHRLQGSATMNIQEWRAQGRYVPFGPHRIFHVDSAPDDRARPVLVLIHGFPTASWDFAKIWPALAARFRVIAADMLGFGFSSKPRKHGYSIMEQADVFDAVLGHHGVDRHHVLAHDYGDTVAQELLARDLERTAPRLETVCFLNGGIFPETHRARRVQKLLEGPLGPAISRLTTKATFSRSMASIFGPATQPSEDELDAFWTLASHDDGHLLAHELIHYMADRRRHRERWVGALTEARCPLAVIDGAADPVSGAHMVARWREVVGKGYVVLLDGIGHYPQIEAPDDVLRSYFAFLADAGITAPAGTG